MSRIGKLPIKISEGVKINANGSEVIVEGPKGSLKYRIPKGLSLKVADSEAVLEIVGKDPNLHVMQGTYRSIINSAVLGVTNGWSKVLELVGTGYRAELQDSTLVFALGFSHPVKVPAPQGISYKVEKNLITVMGIDKELVGQVAANIRAIRPPEPYKGKGVRYQFEEIRKKAGKAAKAQA